MNSVLGIPISDTWTTSPLKRITSVLNRGSAPEYVDESPVRVISQAANQYGGLDWSRTRFHNFNGDPTKLKGHLQENDIIINSTGTGTLGRVGYFTEPLNGIPCMADGHVTVVRVKKHKVNPRFVYYWLTSKPFQEYIHSSLAIGATNQIELNRDRLSDTHIPNPPISEQQRIVDFLEAETAHIDRLIETQNRVLEKLAERRMAGITQAVSGTDQTGTRPSSLTWLEKIPSTWKEVRLSLIARMGSGHTPSRSHPEWWVDCTIPWITTGEVRQVRNDRLEDLHETREKISELGLANSAAELRPAGTVVLCRTASAGYSAVMGTDMATSQDFVTWTCGPRLNPYYLLWCLRAMRPDLLGRLAMGSTHKTIYVPDLQMLRIPLPPIGEQQKIVQQIREQNARIDRLADAVRLQVALLAERRQALITAAVTGQIDVSTASGRGIED
ncbi:restriction endonuclease subunit S [Actinosynnema mirum]|uniref:Restriction modification system DNA specificity domain protein n=1 Tax=Actinosynnema mirum (strain ATCC 29888 / DSM 43827 / JCM 3225 / NBRC 14064 / NCIMB 13271 / NRRL B-12336 / IMRU 3971 / 101) TaxID=446462 RepID=C6WNJ9_ACTMD|nr:restriction endonuclease subunit S [Actinosynnema mirum]ACU34918.1 restriction modification system DNA specificity domain protein [Actinosynnema mirum DSM 43827]